MADTPQAGQLIAKARRALASARVLFDDHDFDGACNRAYYAMFLSAEAAVLKVGHEPPRTHRGLLIMFARELVTSGRVDPDLGRQLHRAAQLRNVADYTGDQVRKDHTQSLLAAAETFVRDISSTFALGDFWADGDGN